MNNSNKDGENNNIYNKTNKINYFNKSSKNGKNKVNTNLSSQKKICINISASKKNLDNKNINKINNIDNIKKEYIKRTELFKPKSKNKFIQNFYSNTTNTNTNNTNKKSNNNTNSININNNNKKENENKEEKIFIDSNTNNTNSYSNQKEILYESVDIEQLNNCIIANNRKISNKRNKSIKNGERYTLDSLNSNHNKNDINISKNHKKDYDFQTYTLPFKANIIKVNIIKNDAEENKNNRKYSKPRLNKNSKSSTNLKTYIKNNQYINTELKLQMKDKNSLNINNSENSLKLKTNNNIRLSANSISQSTKNTLNIKIYLPEYNNKKKLIKKKAGKSLNQINPKKETIQLSTNRSLDMKYKNSYLLSSRINTNRKSKENKINIKNKNINIDLNSIQENIDKRKYGNNKMIFSEYKLKLEAIKSRIYKLLNIYSLIALKSINSNSKDDQYTNNDDVQDKDN